MTGELHIGATPTPTFNIGLIAECAALFLARHPTVRLKGYRAEELAAAQIGAKLRVGE